MEYLRNMRKVSLDLLKMKEQLELIDILSDTANEDEQELLDGLANFLDSIVSGNVVCFRKDTNE